MIELMIEVMVQWLLLGGSEDNFGNIGGNNDGDGIWSVVGDTGGRDSGLTMVAVIRGSSDGINNDGNNSDGIDMMMVVMVVMTVIVRW